MAWVGAASCITDNQTDYSALSECSISSFTLGDIEYTVTGKNQYGEDSTYTKKITGSTFKFAINQATYEIYNPDSLPLGTPVNKIVCKVTGDGNMIYHNPDYDPSKSDSQEWRTVSSDSIDFTKPVTIRVQAYNGMDYRDYTVRVNVHKQAADSTQWNQEGTKYPGYVLEEPHAVKFGKQVAVLGKVNGQLSATVTANGTNQWSEVKPVNLSADAKYLSATGFQDKLYITDGKQLFASADAFTWEAVASDTEIGLLMGANKQQIFGMGEYQFMASANGANWTPETTEYSYRLPDTRVCSASMPLDNNSKITRTILAGQIADSTDSIATVWYRQGQDPWSYMYTSEDKTDALPNLNNLVVLHYYENFFIAFGGTKRGTKYPGTPLSKLYASADFGLTWRTQDNDKYIVYPTLPAQLAGNTNAFTAYVDDNYYIWIMFQNTGDVWRGRLNKMGFERQ